MVATRGRTFKRPWRRSCHSSKLKSSSAPIGRKDSWCFHAVGSSNAPLLGSTAAEGSQRIGRTSIATRWRSCGLPQSASCSENFVIPPDVFGQTLRGCLFICGAGHRGGCRRRWSLRRRDGGGDDERQNSRAKCHRSHGASSLNKSDEAAPLHSITSSALASSVGRFPSGSSFVLDRANDRREYGAASASSDRL